MESGGLIEHGTSLQEEEGEQGDSFAVSHTRLRGLGEVVKRWQAYMRVLGLDELDADSVEKGFARHKGVTAEPEHFKLLEVLRVRSGLSRSECSGFWLHSDDSEIEYCTWTESHHNGDIEDWACRMISITDEVEQALNVLLEQMARCFVWECIEDERRKALESLVQERLSRLLREAEET